MNAATSICAQAVTAAVPLVLAGLGELVAETAGVINVGIEGLMLTGCVAAFAGAAVTGSGYVGVGLAMAAAAALALVFALVTVAAKADQIVAGTALNLLAAGASGTAWLTLQRAGHGNLTAGAFGRVDVPGLADLPFFGPVLFQQYGLFYASALLAIGVAAAFRFTRLGLIVRALGDAPAACDAAGVSVRRGRILAVLFAGACAGAAGSYLSIMRTASFAPDMTGGKGFVVLALVIFGRWKVWGLAAGCLFFGVIDALQQHLQGQALAFHLLGHSFDVASIPYPFFQMLPYVMALGALAAMKRGSAGPAFLGQAW